MTAATGVGRRTEQVLLPVAGLAVVLGAFELASRTNFLPRSSFPPVTTIFAELADIAITSEFWSNVGSTARAWAIAMVIAIAIGVPLGMLVGATRLGHLLTKFTIDFLRPIPSVALIPVLILMFGPQPKLKITLAVIGAVFPLLLQSMYGVRDTDPVAKDTVRSFGLGPVQRLHRLVLPSCLPFVLTGLRISSSIAVILVITGEYIVIVGGIGEAVFLAQNSGAYAQMYAYVVAAGLLGLALNIALQFAERRLLFWHASQRERSRP